MNIGEKIRNAREDMDILQSDMARLIPMNQSNYSKIERNLQEPNLEQFKRICQILNLDPRYLLGLDNFEMITDDEMKILSAIRALVCKNQKK